MQRSFSVATFALLVWCAFGLLTLFTQGSTLFASVNVEILIFYFIAAFFVGSIFPKKNKQHASCFQILQLSRISEKLKIWVIFLYFITIIIVISRKWFYEYSFEAEMQRPSLYSPSKTLDGPIFASLYVIVLYLKSCASVFSQFLFIREIAKQRYLLPMLVGFAMLLDSLVFLAKGVILELIFCFTIGFLIFPHKGDVLKSKYFKRIFISFFLASFFIFILITFQRGVRFFDELVIYLEIGPVLLTNLVENSHIIKGSANLSLLFSGYEYLVNIAFRALGFQIQTYGYDWVKMLNEPVTVAQSVDQLSQHSTFYTLLAEPFLFLGHCGVVITGFLLGFLLPRLEGYYRFASCEFSLFWCFYLTKIMVFGIFSSPFSSTTLWMVIIISLFMHKFIYIKSEIIH